MNDCRSGAAHHHGGGGHLTQNGRGLHEEGVLRHVHVARRVVAQVRQARRERRVHCEGVRLKVVGACHVLRGLEARHGHLAHLGHFRGGVVDKGVINLGFPGPGTEVRNVALAGRQVRHLIL